MLSHQRSMECPKGSHRHLADSMGFPVENSAVFSENLEIMD